MTITLPKMNLWQRDLYDFYLKNPKGKWCVCLSPRQIGKSIFAQILLIDSALRKNDSVSICISPVLSQSRKMFKDVNKIAKPVLKSSNASILEIEFINGSTILFKSAEQGDTIRGNTVRGSGIMVVDEAAYIKDDLFYSIAVPTTNVYNSSIFIFSTPKQKQGFFFNLYMQGLEKNDKIVSFNWSKYDTSEFLSEETKEIYRKQMPKLAFKSEILAEFIDSESTVFGEYEECIRDTEINYSRPVWIGVDWGTGGGLDNTAIAIGQLGEKGLEVKRIDAFNDKTVQETIDYLVRLTNEFSNDVTVVVEKNSIGTVYFQVLREAIENPKALLTLFTTTNKSKDQIIKRLSVCFEQKKISIPRDQKLINELNTYECKPSPTGLPTYNAKPGCKDDRVMSLAFLVNKLYLEL